MKNAAVVLLSALVAGAGLAPVVQADTYEADTAHTTIGFAVKHMVLATVRGTFGEFEASLDYNAEDPSATRGTASIKTASINTANQKRDDHLRSPDFFDVAAHPEITFVTKSAASEGGKLVLTGDLTIRGVTKEIALPVEVSGPITDPWGNVRIGFEGATTINRQDFGVSWNKVLDAGGVVVGDDVKVEISFEGIKKQD